MGYSSHLAVKLLDSSVSPSARAAASTGLKLYYGQLALNLAWTPLFFGLKQTGVALVDIVALTGSVFYLTKTLHGPTGGKSSYLLVPYCVWLSLASYLNAGIWYLNKNRALPKRD
jgi:translocator protein